MLDAKLNDEQGRLAALRRYEILDTPREEPFEKITSLVQAVLSVPIATVSLIDADRQWYKSCVGMESTDLPRSQAFCTHTIQSREPLIIPDALQDPRFANYATVIGEPFIRSYLGIPLSTPDGYNLGSLCALDRKPRNFDAAQIEVMKSFAALVMDELELRRIAQFDSLTEAVTRRSFLLELDQAIRLCDPDMRSSVLVLDVDHFKKINDGYGHGVGDVVLRKVSLAVRSLLPKGGLLGRLGGEEFGVLLKGCNLAEAQTLAEGFREAIASLRFPDEPEMKVTASFGVCTFSDDTQAAEAVLKCADEALYVAKQTGRNRCCSAPQEEMSFIH